MALDDPHAALRDEVMRTVLEGPGETAPALRQAVAAGHGVPADLAELVAKIQRHAYTVTDEDVARLQALHGDDRMFEIIVSATLGAARHRLARGRAALEEA